MTNNSDATSFKALSLFRIGVAICCIIQILSVKSDLLNIFGQYGFNRAELVNLVLPEYAPRIGWILTEFNGLSEVVLISSLFWIYLVALFCLALGFLNKIMAFIAFIIHLLFCGSGLFFMYGLDYMTTSCLFYCLIFPVNGHYSVRPNRSVGNGKTQMANFGLIMLKVHLCVIYFFGGFSKILGTHWWNGEAIWRAVTQPGFTMLDMTWLSTVPIIPIVVGWLVLLVETFYSLFINLIKTRLVWLLAAFAMHLGIGYFMGLYQFAMLMIVWNMCAYGHQYFLKSTILKEWISIVVPSNFR